MADSFAPPENVRSAARRGLELRKKWGRGGLSNAEASDAGIGSGVQRATNLANGDTVSLDTIKRMSAFFSRHQKNYRPGTKESDGGPTAGTIAWLLWGGNAGRAWVERILREQDQMAGKAGQRNNRSDRQRIRNIRQQAQTIVATTLELEPTASDEPTASADMATAKAVQIDPAAHPGAMVALMLTPEQQAMIAPFRLGDMANSEADHITLLYLADDAQLITGYKNKVIETLAGIADECEPVLGTLNGYGRFSASGDLYPVFANYDSAALFDLRAKLVHCLCECGIELPDDHGFTPHLTLGYLPAGEPLPQLDLPDMPLSFPSVSLIWAGERIDYMLFGMGEDDEEDDDDGKVSIEIEVKGEAVKGFELQQPTASQPLITGLVRAIKSADEWALEVLGVPFGGPNGGKDSDGEYFSGKTNIYSDKLPSVPAVYFHGWDENNKPSSEPQYIGMATYERTDAKGHWYKVILDKANSYAQRVWTAAKQGIARASSGSISHLVRKERDGHITHWPVAELSIFDAVGKRQPTNQYAVALPVLKSVYAQAGLTLPDDISPDSAQAPEDAAIGAGSTPAQGRASAKANETDQQDDLSIGVYDMSDVNIQELVAQSVASALAQRDAAAKAEADRQAEIANAAKAAAADAAKATRDAMQAEIDAAKAAADAAKAEAAEARRLPGGAPYAAKFDNVWKYDHLGIDDMAFAIGVLNAAKGMRFGDSPANGASENLRRALAVRLLDADDKDGQFTSAKAAMKGAGMAMKANELNQSTLSSYGDEWVGVTYSTQLWDKVRLATPIAANIPTVEIPQGSESIVIPVLGNSPTFYLMAQAANQASNPGGVTPTITTSRLNTANKTLTASKLGAAVNYTGELEEDSFLPWVQELRGDLVKEAAEVMEHVIIDGDTATGATTNINTIGGTPSGSEAYLAFDGFRKLALVTNTSNARSGGTLGVDDYLETLKLLGLGGRNAYDKGAVAFIVDMYTHWATLNLAEVKNQDVFIAPTLQSGMLTSIWGTRVFASPNMHRANQDATYGLKANTAGKVDLTTASNNTTGSILAVRFDQWRLGYKRRWAFEVQRDAISDSTVIVGTMRIGLTYRDTEASGISYNIT